MPNCKTCRETRANISIIEDEKRMLSTVRRLHRMTVAFIIALILLIAETTVLALNFKKMPFSEISPKKAIDSFQKQ